MANVTLSSNPHRNQLDHRPRPSEDLKPSFAELMGVLSYNQGLVEFADSKAGSLILLNSLLIAAVGALPNEGQSGTLKMLSVVACSLAVFLCFQVISSRDNSGQESDDDSGPFFAPKPGRGSGWEQNDFVFFGCVATHGNGEDYCRAFGRSDADARRRALLQRTFIIAGIAKRKFGQYRTAQKVTSLALGLWLLVNLMPFF